MSILKQTILVNDLLCTKGGIEMVKNLMTWEQWVQWSANYTMLPAVHCCSLPDDRVVSWEKLWAFNEEAMSEGSVVKGASQGAARNSSNTEAAILLESDVQHGGRYTYMSAAPPTATLYGKGQQADVQLPGQKQRQIWSGSPLDLVKKWMTDWRAPRWQVDGKRPPWTGGCSGYWSYDVARSIERLPELAEDDLNLPDYAMVMVNSLYIIDHQDQELWIVHYTPWPKGQLEADTSQVFQQSRSQTDIKQLKSLYEQAERQLEKLDERFRKLTMPSKQMSQRATTFARMAADEVLQMKQSLFDEFQATLDREAYMQAAARIQTYIQQGDIFQANLSVRFSRAIDVATAVIYEWMRLTNPSPYMGLLRFPQVEIACNSPELLIQLQDGKLITRPIAGTRRRGRDSAEEQLFEQELRHDEKELAEHIMLVDLLRNDLGRVSRYGSVQVDKLMYIEKYSHVMHLVSQVTGELADNVQAYDVLAATFPGGTITGAPKIRTMEIIEELEPVRRGIYTGSIGWIDYNGDMEFNIVIRTMVVKDGVAHVQVGAGIVADSDPAREYVESTNKAKALWKALEFAERWEPKNEGGTPDDTGDR